MQMYNNPWIMRPGAGNYCFGNQIYNPDLVFVSKGFVYPILEGAKISGI